MALRAVSDHPKFADLKARLGRPKYAALGCLEAIWHFTGRFTPQGNIGKYTDHAIEAWVEWDGEPGALIAALVDARWLDTDPTHRLIVHDWNEYADSMVHTDLARHCLLFGNGAVPESRRLNQSERERFKSWLREEKLEVRGPGRPAKKRPKCRLNADSLPELAAKMTKPEPEPVPEPEPKTKTSAKGKPSQFVLPEWISREVWDDFEEMRRKLRAPLTDRARLNIVADLVKLEAQGQHAEDVLNQSITNSWRGVFALKVNQKARHGANNPSPAKQRIDANRRALAEAAIKRGWFTPDDAAGSRATPVAEPRHDGIDGRVPDGLRAVGPEILAPATSGRAGGFEDQARTVVLSTA
jgi:hypothetical protein